MHQEARRSGGRRRAIRPGEVGVAMHTRRFGPIVAAAAALRSSWLPGPRPSRGATGRSGSRARPPSRPTRWVPRSGCTSSGPTPTAPSPTPRSTRRSPSPRRWARRARARRARSRCGRCSARATSAAASGTSPPIPPRRTSSTSPPAPAASGAPPTAGRRSTAWAPPFARSRWAPSRSTPRAWSGPARGEPDHGGGSAYYGKGIYKSTDDGATWTNMGLEDGDTIGQIVIDPRDDDRVFVAVMGALHDTEPTRGLFMTENGGRQLDPRDRARERLHRRHRRDDQQDQPGHHAGDDVGQDP